MTSRSRLGKGLGALFPALPGEDDETNADKSRQQDNEVQNSGNKQPTLQGLPTESDGQQRQVRDASEKDKAKREHSTTHSGRANSQLAATAASSKSGHKRSNTGQRRVSVSESLGANVSRETSTSKRTTKRRPVPSISSLEHPSDLFFGPTTTNVSRETSSMVEASEGVDRQANETRQSTNHAGAVRNGSEPNEAGTTAKRS